MINAKHTFLVTAGVLGCGVSTVVYQPDPPSPYGSNPVFEGTAVQADEAPAPISGGTVRIVTAGGAAYAVASDPDEDQIDVVALDSTSASLVGSIALLPGDEPNRMAFDTHGLVHVVLRGGGSIATIDPTTATLVSRRSVCPAPRGIAFDAKSDSLYVACATGELVTLPVMGDVTKVVRLDRDLRDVVVTGDKLVVTRFRSAERLVVDPATGTIASRSTPGAAATSSYSSMDRVVAWKTIGDGKGGTVMLHQLAATDALVVAPTQTYYATTGSPISQSAVTVESTGDRANELDIGQAIDMTMDSQGVITTLSLMGEIESGTSVASIEGNVTYYTSSTDPTYQFTGIDDGDAIGVPYKVIQRRVPTAELEIFSGSFTKGGVLNTFERLALPQKAAHIDTGFDIFHIPTFVGTACMSCHPEGGDDGHTWKFTIGGATEARRTQSLRGGVITTTAPYHWNGDLNTLGDLCDEVFTHRMGGGKVEPAQEAILAHWLNAIPRIPVRTDLDAKRVEAGKSIFNGAGGCATCHTGGAGAIATNQDIGKTDVLGQTRAIQVPALLDVADRAPYMHDGCAATLMDRFTNPSCGGSNHGNVAQLSSDDLTSLTTYLESL